jgi:hypothetical protein
MKTLVSHRKTLVSHYKNIISHSGKHCQPLISGKQWSAIMFPLVSHSKTLVSH